MTECKNTIMQAISQHDCVHPQLCLDLVKKVSASKFCLVDRTTIMNALTERGKTSPVKAKRATSASTPDGKNQDHFTMHDMLTEDNWKLFRDPKIPHTQKIFEITHVGLKLDIVYPSEKTK
eukprot:11976623-Karenia_brevis.AAC.1